MALRLGAKQSFGPMTIATGGTLIGAIKNLLGAKYVILRVFGGTGAFNFTPTVALSPDGTNAPVAGSFGTASNNPPVIRGTAANVTSAVGLFFLIVPDPLALLATYPQLTEFLYPFLLLTGTATGTQITGVNVEAWPVYETAHPNLPPALEYTT